MHLPILIASLTLAPEAEEIVHRFYGPMPTGVTVSPRGRIFATFPRWGDRVTATVVELKNGKEVPYPSQAFNRMTKRPRDDRFVSVQSVVVDPAGRLWAVDTGSIKMNFNSPGTPKLVCFNLNTDRVQRVYRFPSNVVLPSTYLNDVRFDLTRGRAGYAFLTDSSDKGPNGLIVLDLASGRSWRRLHQHPAAQADRTFTPTAEGKPFLRRPKNGPPTKPKIGSDGIAIAPQQDRLYFCPLISRRLYSVPISALVDERLTDAHVGSRVQTVGPKGASDGLIASADGTLYVTDYERSSVRRMIAPGQFETVIQFDKKWWPDTLAIGPNGYLYTMANQLQRQPQFQRGVDRRVRPYILVRRQLGVQMPRVTTVGGTALR